MTITEEQTENINKRSQSNEIEGTRNFLSLLGSTFNLPSYVCFCDRAPGPSHALTPRPHFKTEYCSENDNRGTTTNSVFSPNNVSSNIPKKFQEKSNYALGTKKKSIFSFTRPPCRTNSVIIEELPNEPSNNTYANVRVKSNETVANKNTNITNKSQTNDDEQVKVPNAKNLNKNSEQSGNSNKNCNNISRGKVKVADKYKNKTRKPEKYIPKV